MARGEYLMADLPEFWGDADFEVISVTNLGNSQLPTKVELRMYGEIRGEVCEHTVTFICDPTNYNDLAEEIAWNCLYPWVQSIIDRQDAATQPEVI